jgi:hypothetical protein
MSLYSCVVSFLFVSSLKLYGRLIDYEFVRVNNDYAQQMNSISMNLVLMCPIQFQSLAVPSDMFKRR